MRISRSTLLTLGLLAGCDFTSPTVLVDGTVPLVRLQGIPTVYRSNSTFDDAELGTVATQVAWDALYVRLMGNTYPPPTTGPALDFADSTLVYVGIGKFPNFTHSVILDSAAVVTDILVVYYTEEDWVTCGGAATEVSPTDAAQVPRWHGSVRFVRKLVVTTC